MNSNSARSVVVPRFNIEGLHEGEVTLPTVFSTPIRYDLIRRAVIAVQTSRFQPQGRDPLAGKRTTAVSRGVGLGIARVPRVKGSGYSKAGQAALAASIVGGRQAHPPKSAKVILKKMNSEERKLAIRSSIAATALRSEVLKRGHVLDEKTAVPIVVEDKLESLNTAKALLELLRKIGLQGDIHRAKRKKIRAGKGKRRGRKYKRPRGPLIIVSEDRGIGRAGSNVAGIDIIRAEKLNAELLSPGTHPGRLSIWSESALKKLEAARLFY